MQHRPGYPACAAEGRSCPPASSLPSGSRDGSDGGAGGLTSRERDVLRGCHLEHRSRKALTRQCTPRRGQARPMIKRRKSDETQDHCPS